MTDLRYAVFGTGFWSQFQIAAWNEVGGVKLAAAYNRTLSRAQRIAERFGIPHVYDDPEALLAAEQLDFMDIITEIDAHAPLVLLAAKHKIPVICQKPMAPNLQTAEAMVAACKDAQIPFYVHENWRWQTPVRALKTLLLEEHIGRVFRARIDMLSGFSSVPEPTPAAHSAKFHHHRPGQPCPGYRPFFVRRSGSPVLPDAQNPPRYRRGRCSNHFAGDGRADDRYH
jgi:predicted dehydrogenase